MLAFSGGSVQGGTGVGAAESSLSAASGHRSTCCPQWRWLRCSIHLVLQMVYFQMCAEGRSKKFFVHIVLSRFRLCSDRYITAMLRPLFHLCYVYPFLSCLVGLFWLFSVYSSVYVPFIFFLCSVYGSFYVPIMFCLCSKHVLSSVPVIFHWICFAMFRLCTVALLYYKHKTQKWHLRDSPDPIIIN